MKSVFRIIAMSVVFISIAVFAQETPAQTRAVAQKYHEKAETKNDLPLIPPEVITKFMKASWLMTQAQVQLTADKEELDRRTQEQRQAAAAISAACGDKHQAILDPNKDPVCADLPAPKPETQTPEPPKK